MKGETWLPALPGEVSQAFVSVWQQAIHLARGAAEQALAEQRQVLVAERIQATAVEDQARQDAAQYRQQTAEAMAARQATETRLADLELLLEQRTTQIQDLQQQRDSLLRERGDAQQHSLTLQQELQALRNEAEQARALQENYLRGVEDRSHREIDRAREESKSRATQLKEANRQLDDRQRRLEAAHAELSEARQSEASQRARADTLSQQLVQQLPTRPAPKSKVRKRATTASTRTT